jgi:hypothetical protein
LKSSSPSAETHPNVFAWFYLVKRFTDDVKKTWGGAAAGKQEKKPAQGKKEEKPKAEGDDVDLFGDDDEEDEVSSYLIGLKIYHWYIGSQEGPRCC